MSLPWSIPERQFNIVSLLLDRHVAEGRGADPALWVDGEVVSYLRLQEQTNRAGNALRSLGVEPEQRVAVLLPDGLEFVVSFLGALKIGAVPVPLNTGVAPADLQFFLADSRSRALIATGSLAAVLPEGSTLLKGALLVGDLGAAVPYAALDYRAALAAASPRLDAFATGTDEPCYWLYSSGTTGRPKGTVHLHGDMVACVSPYADEVVSISTADVTFSVAKLFFSYGLVNSLFLPLMAGASSVLVAGRADSATILATMRRHRATLFFTVPTSIAQTCLALEQGENRDAPFGSARLAVSAGEPLPEPLYRRWLDLTGVEVLDGVGSTEVGYIYCSNRPGEVRPGSSGRLIGAHEARVVDESALDVPVGEEGELWVRAGSTALYYWNQRGRTKAAFVGEWLRTGDRYRQDEGGYFWYLGRTTDVFKVSGQWVSPTEVESCLLEHPAVQECAVVGVPDRDGLLRPRAFVVPRPEHEVDPRELQDFVKARLLPHKYPRWVDVVDSLPKTASGKIQRYRLRESETQKPLI